MNKERIKHLENFIRDAPDDPFNHYALAMEYYEALPERSLKILGKLLDGNPQYLPTYYKAAHLYWEQEDRENADMVFSKGIALAKEFSDAKSLKELQSAYQNFLMEKE